MLEYYLEDNVLTAAPDDLKAQVYNVRSYTQNEIIDRIMRIGAGLTRSDVASVLEAQKQVVAEMLGEGCAVTTELFDIFPSIQGVFNSSADSFDPSRHRVRQNLHVGTVVREAVKQIKTKKVHAPVTGIIITEVIDAKTGSVNNQLTPGGNLKISGSKLKIVGDDFSIGVFFVNQDSPQAYKVNPEDIIVNNPAEVIVVIPSLPTGTFKLEITSLFSGGNTQPLKTPHNGKFDKLLTVQ